MLYGVSYYPEHKTEEELQWDLKCIVESGINTVRMGEFAWCRMEPEDGRFAFDWLEQVITWLGEHGIKTIVCTPTACPPAWMIEKHPEILYTDNRGITRPFGGRRHYCYNNPDYRMYSRRITLEIAKRFGRHPYVAGFQIDNEPAQEGTGRCHCPVCDAKFQRYLKDKYKTIEAFNRRSGGIFWSQEYTDFSQIHLPVNTIETGTAEHIKNFYENPTVRLEAERFASDCQIEYQTLQSDILKAHTRYPVTTNATGLATNSIDYYKSTKDLDVYAFDSYPELRNAEVDSFPYAFARGVKEGKPFWVLEFMSGGGHRFSGSGRRQPNPGALKQAVLQSYAHGAELMLHFQYRTFPFGAEQLNYAIVDMDGIPRRRYYEMQETAKLLETLKPYQDAAFANETAILLSYDTHWALRIKPVNDDSFRYLDFCNLIYRQLEQIGIHADVISADADLSKYKCVILPAAFILPEAQRQALRDYVAAGGTLLASFLSSAKNEDNVGYTLSLPAGLTDVFGVCVSEVEPIFDSNHAGIRLTLGEESLETTDLYWCDLLEGEAKPLGVYTDTYKKGSMIVSEHGFSKGKACYLGTGLKDAAMRRLLAYVCSQAGVEKDPFLLPEKVTCAKRVYEGKTLYYFFNFNQEERSISLNGTWQDVLQGSITDTVTLGANGYAVLLEV